jgi:hypothetical protein
MNYNSVLDIYSLSDILELNDKTEAECLEYLVETEFIFLPEILPCDFND